AVTARTVSVSDQTVGSLTDGFGIYYTASGGTFRRGVALATGAANDVVAVLSATARAPLVLFTEDGDDVITLQAATADGFTLADDVVLDAGAGKNSLMVTEEGGLVADSMALSGGTLSSAAGGFTVLFAAVGGSFGSGLTVVGSEADGNRLDMTDP